VFGGFVVMLLGAGGFAALAPLPLRWRFALTALEVLVAFLQAYVFTMLTCMYVSTTPSIRDTSVLIEKSATCFGSVVERTSRLITLACDSSVSSDREIRSRPPQNATEFRDQDTRPHASFTDHAQLRR